MPVAILMVVVLWRESATTPPPNDSAHTSRDGVGEEQAYTIEHLFAVSHCAGTRIEWSISWSEIVARFRMEAPSWPWNNFRTCSNHIRYKQGGVLRYWSTALSEEAVLEHRRVERSTGHGVTVLTKHALMLKACSRRPRTGWQHYHLFRCPFSE